MPDTDFQLSQLDQLNAEFEKAAPQDILKWAATRFGERLALVTSFQPTGIVTLHMLSEIAPHTPVLTLDTGLLFPETYTLINELEQRLNLNLIRLRPAQTVEQQAEAHGPELWARNPDQCCNLRKVIPLDQSLKGYDAWITGLRRDQSEGRSSVQVVAWDQKHQNLKLCPFATWTEEMIWLYLNAHELPYNHLHDQGYPSIGCYPCTQPAAPGADKRAGRWVNSAKTECGIHLPQKS
ncbi:phosphoadenosine phosphosulfate reductase [Anaerolineae bacterium]|nr:phosphoadenosine phosphosulfate reductase [Anaerolineae bacterium]